MYHVYKKWTNAKKTEYGGHLYDSRFEAQYAIELTMRQNAKEIKSFETQVTLPLEVNNYVVCTYKIDFVVYHNDGTIEYVETKGYPTDVWKLKWKLFEALYCDKPNVRLTIVQQGRFKPPRLRKKKI